MTLFTEVKVSEEKSENKQKKKKTENLEMDEISVKYASSDDENNPDKVFSEEPSVLQTQDSISKTITMYVY